MYGIHSWGAPISLIYPYYKECKTLLYALYECTLVCHELGDSQTSGSEHGKGGNQEFTTIKYWNSLENHPNELAKKFQLHAVTTKSSNEKTL